MSLTDVEARNAKPREKPYKLSDAKGMPGITPDRASNIADQIASDTTGF